MLSEIMVQAQALYCFYQCENILVTKKNNTSIAARMKI